ncbi:MAG: amidase [Pseudomonadota bacterium]
MSTARASDVARRLAEGAVSARDVAEACLDRIAAREEEVRAFVHLSPEYVRAQADAIDAHRKAGRPLGALHGIPVALKDIIDTVDYPTENGTVLDAGRRPSVDSAIAARLRAAGALVIGKTVTTELAFQYPGPTRNPHNPNHTPGGSSSGSAAAVADGMVPIAFGTQTVGSMIRPASFCGVVGIKLTHGTVPMTGVLSTAEPLDTAGVFALNVADAALALNVCQGHDPADPRTRVIPRADLFAAALEPPPVTPRIAIIGGPFWEDVSADVRGLFEELENLLGDEADRVSLPEVFGNAFPAHMQVMKAQFARNLRNYRERGAEKLSPQMTSALAEGAKVLATEYLSGLDWQTALRTGLEPIFDRYDVIVTPSAGGEAPPGLESTGDSKYNALWTFVGAPCANIPAGKGTNGLPIGVQLVGRAGEDARLIRNAAWLEHRLSEAG